MIALLLFVILCLVLMLGYPVAFSLAGVSMLFAGLGIIFGYFDHSYLTSLTPRLFGIMNNDTLVAVPLFIFMGLMLERCRIAENLLGNMAQLMGRFPGGLGISVILVGTLLAASTGIVGATVVTMGLLSLPTMLQRGYSPTLATGTICATGTLGQIIPPSIVLVLLGDILGNAYQQAQLKMGVTSIKTISVGDLFMGALIPGLILVGLYLLYVIAIAIFQPQNAPAAPTGERANTRSLLSGLMPPVILIIAVLGSILGGIATPTEAAGIGAFGSSLLALLRGDLTRDRLNDVARGTLESTAMVFMILIGAAVFSTVFRGFGGDELIQHGFAQLPGGAFSAMLIVMTVIFLLGFILDFIEIIFVIVPIVGPILLMMGIDPIWLGIMIAINLQTSFLTPPFGFALFYLRGVAPSSISTATIYRGVMPFIALQLIVLLILAMWPDLATWLPDLLKSS
jgi:tripartite ATP-independent transporter DctM subunit